MNYPSLLSILEEQLVQCDNIHECALEFSSQVVALYVCALQNLGIHIYEDSDDVYVELQDEVLKMLRVKTYGLFHFSLYE